MNSLAQTRTSYFLKPRNSGSSPRYCCQPISIDVGLSIDNVFSTLLNASRLLSAEVMSQSKRILYTYRCNIEVIAIVPKVIFDPYESLSLAK